MDIEKAPSYDIWDKLALRWLKATRTFLPPVIIFLQPHLTCYLCVFLHLPLDLLNEEMRVIFYDKKFLDNISRSDRGVAKRVDSRATLLSVSENGIEIKLRCRDMDSFNMYMGEELFHLLNKR